MGIMRIIELMSSTMAKNGWLALLVFLVLFLIALLIKPIKDKLKDFLKNKYAMSIFLLSASFTIVLFIWTRYKQYYVFETKEAVLFLSATLMLLHAFKN